MAVPADVLVPRVNQEKKVFQLTFFPTRARNVTPKALVESLRLHATRARELRDTQQVARCVLLIDGKAGAAPGAGGALDAISDFARELVGLEEFLDILDSIIVANPDDVTALLLRAIRAMPGYHVVKDKVRVLR